MESKDCSGCGNFSPDFFPGMPRRRIESFEVLPAIQRNPLVQVNFVLVRSCKPLQQNAQALHPTTNCSLHSCNCFPEQSTDQCANSYNVFERRIFKELVSRSSCLSILDFLSFIHFHATLNVNIGLICLVASNCTGKYFI